MPPTPPKRLPESREPSSDPATRSDSGGMAGEAGDHEGRRNEDSGVETLPAEETRRDDDQER